MKIFRSAKLGIFIIISIGIGIVLGGFLFSDSQKRSFLSLSNCQQTCLNPNELMGLVASVVVQQTPFLLQPTVVKETERVIVIEHPNPESPIHYVIIPKKDIKNISEVADEDMIYLQEVFAVIGELVQSNGLTKYKVVTYGPGYQDVTYLHFHLMAEK